MPQLHHRDPSIIGLLGAAPILDPSFDFDGSVTAKAKPNPPPLSEDAAVASEAFDDVETPPQTPGIFFTNQEPRLEARPFNKPFYDIIVDGVHCHPNSVRLAYQAFPEGCILITDG